MLFFEILHHFQVQYASNAVSWCHTEHSGGHGFEIFLSEQGQSLLESASWAVVNVKTQNVNWCCDELQQNWRQKLCYHLGFFLAIAYGMYPF